MSKSMQCNQKNKAPETIETDSSRVVTGEGLMNSSPHHLTPAVRVDISPHMRSSAPTAVA